MNLTEQNVSLPDPQTTIRAILHRVTGDQLFDLLDQITRAWAEEMTTGEVDDYLAAGLLNAREHQLCELAAFCAALGLTRPLPAPEPVGRALAQLDYSSKRHALGDLTVMKLTQLAEADSQRATAPVLAVIDQIIGWLSEPSLAALASLAVQAYCEHEHTQN